MLPFQFEKIFSKKNARLLAVYVSSLLITKTKKNISSMSRETGFSCHSISRSLDSLLYKKESIQRYFISLVHLYATEKNPGFLISDSSQLTKLYAKKMYGLCYDYNGSMKGVFKGLTNVTLAWTNGKITIPLQFDFWISKKAINDTKSYRQKTEISKNQIIKWKNRIPFQHVVLDGEYGNKQFLHFLNEQNISYSIRIACNRNVYISGTEAQLKNHPALKLIRNEKYKTAIGFYKGIRAYFTAHKRNGKNESKQIVFIVSNIEGLSPKEHVLIFSKRWPIEKMFRTLKQSLGIREYQSTSALIQGGHIYATFLAFVELENAKVDKKKKSPEQILNQIRFQKPPQKRPSFDFLEGLIM